MYITSYSIRIVLLSRYVNIYDTMAPMWGISISRTLFFVPAQDSSGFLWILVLSLSRNLLLAGVRKFWFSACLQIFSQVPVNSCIWPGFLQISPDSSRFPWIPVPAKTCLHKTTVISTKRPWLWSGVGLYHGLWWTDALDPAHRRDPDTMGDAAMCWVT